MDASQNPPPAAQDPAAPPPAMLRMRELAAQNPDMGHRSFDSYPWTKDNVFQSQLATALLSSSNLSPVQIALQCRLKRFEGKVGIKIDAAKYEAYRAQPDRPPVDVVPQVILEQEALYEPDVSKRMYASIVNGGQPSQDGQDQDLPSWQRSAPKAALYVNKGDAGAGDGSDKEPYPKKFEEILAFLQTGKEIPGIVQIPDTVIEDASISTTSGRSAPLKPWEKKTAANSDL
ncbi:hypothetical protein BJ166DRAFT_283036 [Pestalotiopsis sp. NC0098]|nr:hypothetical protein BJ166DRAFT_283036 [Pestalotiopsis sp. NC0098]